MTFTINDKKIKKINQNDPDFIIDDGLVMAPRAAIEISNDCPYNHLQILKTCIDRGWIKPIAYMKQTEYTWEKLGE